MDKQCQASTQKQWHNENKAKTNMKNEGRKEQSSDCKYLVKDEAKWFECLSQVFSNHYTKPL